MTKPRIAVDIWSDVMCPWCAVGYTSFAKSVKQVGDELDVFHQVALLAPDPVRERGGGTGVAVHGVELRAPGTVVARLREVQNAREAAPSWIAVRRSRA